MRKNFNDKALLKVAESLKNVVKTAGNKEDLSYLVYDPQVYAKNKEANVKCGSPPLPTCGFSLQDAINNKKACCHFLSLVSAGFQLFFSPPPFGSSAHGYTQAFDYLQAALGNTYELDTQVATSVKLLCMALSFQLGQVISAYKDSDPCNYL